MPDGNQVAATRVPAEPVAQSSSPYPPKILAALHSVMAKCGYVQKKGENKFHGYKYAGEANLLEVLRPAMLEAGLLLIPSAEHMSQIDQHGNMFVTVHYTLAHKDGDVWPEKITVFGAGNDRNKSGGVGDKGLYKALTGANKYLLFKLFQIETGDDPEKDSEADSAPPAKPTDIPYEQRKNAPGISAAKVRMRDIIRELNGISDEPEFTAYLPSIKDFCIEVCTKWNDQWIGPEPNSGLKGQIQVVADQLGIAKQVNSWLTKVELAASVKHAAE